MNSQKFLGICKEYTREWFHDASLTRIEIDIVTKQIVLDISHYRDDKKSKGEVLVRSKLCFSSVTLINLENTVEKFIVDNDISEFNVADSGDRALYKIIGSSGWTLSFLAKEVEYEEQLDTEVFFPPTG